MLNGPVHRGGLRDWGFVLLLTAAQMFSLLDRLALAVLIDPIKKDLHLSDAGFGLLNGIAFGLFYAFMGMPLGWLADRWSRKGTIMLGIGVWSAATAASGLAANFTQLLIARMFVGAGEAGLTPAAYAMVHDRFGRAQLSRAMSLLQAGSLLGAGSAVMLTGFIYTAMQAGALDAAPLIGGLAAWQKTFIVIATPGVFFLLAFPFVRDRPRAKGAETSGDGPTERVSLAQALAARPLFYFLLFLGMAGITISNYGLVSWIPGILGREFGWSPARVGSVYGTLLLVIYPSGLLVGALVTDFLDGRRVKGVHALVPLIAACLGLPAIAAILLPSTPISFLILVACAQFAIILPNGVVPALIQLVTPASARGQVSALYVLSINVIGLGVGPTLIGVISDQDASDPHMLRFALWACLTPGMVIAVASLLWLQVVARKQPIDPSPVPTGV